MNMQQQRDLLYAPIMRSASSIGSLVNSPLDALNNTGRSFGPGGSGGMWTAFVGVVVIVVAAGGLVLLVRWLVQRSPRWGRKQQGQLARTRVEFFERFQTILKRHGLQREPQQTAVEFAETVAFQLNPVLRAAGLQDWPGELVRKFYDVRYGHHEVPAGDLAELSEKLLQLERCLDEKPSKDRGV